MINSEPRITPADEKYAWEFKDAPFGPHSPGVERILHIMRRQPVAGKLVLVETKPHREWVLARLPGAPDKRVEMLGGPVFNDRADAEWHIFKQRWVEHTGEVLEEP